MVETVLRSTPLGGPTPKWTATYRNVETDQEVTVSSIERPPKTRTFRVARHGQVKFQRVELTQLPQDTNNHHQGGTTKMARAATTKKSDAAKRKSRKAKKAEEEDLDEELEGLEELDDIEAELDEEPDEIEDGDDEDEEEEKPKRSRSRKASGRAKKGTAKESASKKTSGRAKKKAAAAKSNGTVKEGVGTTEVAKAAKVSPRELRVFLRGNAEKFPKGEDGYRWPSLENKTVQRIIKAVKAAQE